MKYAISNDLTWQKSLVENLTFMLEVFGISIYIAILV
jgi:hypothetical protein